MRRHVVIVLSFFLLSACSVFSPVKTEQQTAYVLNTLPRPVTKAPIRRITLLVAQPTTSQIYNTSQMAYTDQPYQIAYFAKSHWADTPVQMLQGLLTQTLQDTHYFYAVGVPPILGAYDYMLNTQLLQFEQRFYAHSSQMVITLRAQLIKTANNQVVATQQFTVVEAAPESTPYGGVIAANQGMAKVLAQVARFCLVKAY